MSWLVPDAAAGCESPHRSGPSWHARHPGPPEVGAQSRQPRRPYPSPTTRRQPVTLWRPVGCSESLLINDGAGRQGAVCPAHAPLDDVPVARTPSLGSAIKITRCLASSQGDAGISRGSLQTAPRGDAVGGLSVSYAPYPDHASDSPPCLRSPR